MRLADYKGYQIHLPTSGGKAGKGKAVTSNIQVRTNGGFILRKFHFTVADQESRQSAMRHAREFIDAQVGCVAVAVPDCYKPPMTETERRRRETIQTQNRYAKIGARIKCWCGNHFLHYEMFRCLYCEAYFCATCAENHFGKSREQYRQEHPDHFPDALTPPA